MVCWVSIIVFCAAVLRVAENLPLEQDDISALKYPSAEGSDNAFSEEEKELGDALSRDKRTIGFLRQLFPGLSQIVDRKIQMLTRLAFRLIGRLVLRGGAGGGGGTGTASSGDSGRKVSITLPTYPPSVDDDEDEDESGDSTTTTAPDSDSTASTTEADSTTTQASDSENQVAESQVSEVKVRKARDTAKVNNNSDQQTAATGDNDNDLDSSDSAADSEGEGSEDSPRNKRLLNFNLGGGGSGSGGGSGNFLFDIIRLVAGSGTTQEKDEAENAPLEDGSVSASVDGSVDLTGKDDGYSAGVPGPLTRLFVIANRGIANLIQDLILRLAQTSERIVNFKARLITSII
ncbi:cell wall protein IFF6 isoform X5 [Nilaparvata lugens]|nr:cell wall protein IFF6 isoform X5 [Nilaparvata lugens]